MNIENKRILLVGKETYMYPFYYLIDEWSGKNEIATFWVNPMESELDECDLNSSTYYAFKRKGITKDYTLTKANEKFIKICNDKINYEELEALEKKYSHFKNINCQIISDQAMNGHYHYRTMNIPVTYEQQLNWIMCLYENIEEILDDFNPDYIFDCDTAELPRNVLNEVAYHKNIPYISIAYSKYELYKIPSYTLNIGVEEYFQREYNKCLQEADTEEEKKVAFEACKEAGVPVAESTVFADGGEGGLDLGEKVLAAIDQGSNYKPLYDLDLSLKEKIETIAKEIYGADGVAFDGAAAKELAHIEEMGYGKMPVCIAKTPVSFSDDPSKLGAPSGFTLHVREVKVSAGAGFVVALTGKIMTMPGLPRRPAAERIDVDDEGNITGLF